MKFNAKELHKEFYLSRGRREATEISSKDSTRRDRTFENVLETTLYGHAAEVYLIQECGYTDDDRKYKDVIDPEGNSVEIKVTEGDYYVPHVLERAEKAKLETWRGYPDILYVFIGNKKTAEYSLHGKYYWDGQKFSVQNGKISV